MQLSDYFYASFASPVPQKIAPPSGFFCLLFLNLSYSFHMIESAVIQLLFIVPRLISSSLFSCHLFPFQFVMLILSL